MALALSRLSSGALMQVGCRICVKIIFSILLTEFCLKRLSLFEENRDFPYTHSAPKEQVFSGKKIFMRFLKGCF
jgi:hypothetical protein